MKALKPIFTWIDNYFAALFAIIIGFSIFYIEFKRSNVDSADDLLQVQGPLSEYSFRRTSGYRTPGNQYYIWLENYPCTFHISADFLPFFNQNRFEIYVKKGDHLKLSIARDLEHNLNDKNSQITVFSIECDPIAFLNHEETIVKEKSLTMTYVGIFFISAGVIYYLIKRKKQKNKYR